MTTAFSFSGFTLVMDGIYNTNLSRITQQIMRPGGQILPFHLPLLTNAYAEVFEQLLLFEKVSITLGNMSNHALSAIMDVLPLDYLERAFNLEAIEIILPRTLLMTSQGKFGKGMRDPLLLKGTPPVVIGKVQEGAYGDPEEAILDAMKFTTRYSYGYSPTQLRTIARQLAGYIKIGSLSDGDTANQLISSAYEANELNIINLPYIGKINELDYQNRVVVQRLVADVRDLLFMAQNNYGGYNSPEIYTLAKEVIGAVEDAMDVKRSSDALLTHTNLPNFRALFAGGRASLKTALDLRERNENIEFRRWIYSVSDPQELAYIVDHYAEAIANPTGPSHTTLGKLVKGGAMYGFGQAIGALAGASAAAAAIAFTPAGVALGLGVVAAEATKAATEITGNYFLDKVAGYVTQGWTPLQFITKVKALAGTQDRVPLLRKTSVGFPLK